MEKEYLKIGNAADLKGGDYVIFRAFEILPGALSWATLLLVILCSWLAPVFIAFFIIAFDVYWLLKTLYLSLHLRATFSRVQKNLKVDWLARLQGRESGTGNWQRLYHLIILPFYKEPFGVLDETFGSLAKTNYPKEKFIIVLAAEERAGREAQETAMRIQEKYGRMFHKFLITVHPKNGPGELAGKGSNETWAGRKAKDLIDDLKIPYEDIIVSVFDGDTQVYPGYFGCLTYHFLGAEKPHRSSFQPVPVFNNNIWDTSALSRVVATSCTFWQMMQQERPERLATFSSHAMSFKAIVEMDFWNVKNISEDSRIFWKSLLFYDGDYRTIPLYYPVSMDANLAETFWGTIKNVYKQQLRWGWGAENIPYFIYGFLKNKKMPLRQSIRHIFNQIDGFWSWGTNALLIFLLGWLPLALGGEKFNLTVLSYNLPRFTRILMTLAMVGLISSAIYSTILLPPRPPGHPFRKYFYMIFQWILMPLTIIIFGAIPGLEAQTRLMLGRYMKFWVTPKHRVSK
ncbi:MAG: glycosyltransferase family 2 protein [Candidatus Portnoybacteria bacterium]|nr:glycosyltransferase family 2 protein [Candidatus Portnoybacteria bacterium]